MKFPRLGALALACLTLAACAVRLDTGTVRLPDLSLDDVARDAAARCDQALVAIGEQLPDGGLGVPVWDQVRANAQARMEVWGPVWTGWQTPAPTALPEGATAPRPPLKVPKSIPELIAHIATCADQAQLDATVVSDPALRRYLAAGAIARRVEGQRLAGALNLALPPGQAAVSRPEQVIGTSFAPTTPSATPAPDAASATPTPALDRAAVDTELARIAQARHEIEFLAARIPNYTLDDRARIARFTNRVADFEARALAFGDFRPTGVAPAPSADPTQAALLPPLAEIQSAAINLAAVGELTDPARQLAEQANQLFLAFAQTFVVPFPGLPR